MQLFSRAQGFTAQTAQTTQTGHTGQTGHIGRSESPEYYVSVPQRLLMHLRDSPLAIGVYSLVARIYFATHEPVPLSANDLLAYDPTLHSGAAVRALTRLVNSGWLIEKAQAGIKSQYTPSWGNVAGSARPWDLQAAALGRPRHVQNVALDRKLLDLYMGRLHVDSHQPALVERYMLRPLLSLRDIGAYGLAKFGIPQTSPTLLELGLVQHGQVAAVPDEREVLARISQEAMASDTQGMTDKGWLALGFTPACPPEPPPAGQTMVFAPIELIGPQLDATARQQARQQAREHAGGDAGNQIGEITGNQIGCDNSTQKANSASQSPIPPLQDRATIDTGISRNKGKKSTRNQPPDSTPNAGQPEGGLSQKQIKQELPNTPTVQMLQALHIRQRTVAELAHFPADLVQSIINDGKSRPDVRHLAGWVVSMLRYAKNHDWKPKSKQIEVDWSRMREISHTACETDETDTNSSNDAHTVAEAAVVEQCAQTDVGPRAAADEPAAASCASDGDPATTQAPDAAALPPQPAPAPMDPERLTCALRSSMKARLPVGYWPLIAVLGVQKTSSAVQIHCVDRAHMELVEKHIMPLMKSVLVELGLSSALQVVVCMRPAAAPPAPPLPTPPPEWMPPEVWAELPRMARVVFLGATRAGETVRGATPSLDRLLHTRFLKELEQVLRALAAQEAGRAC